MNDHRRYSVRIPRGLGPLGIAIALAWGTTGLASRAAAGERATPATARPPSTPASVPGASATVERLTGMVSAFDPGARTVDLVTGVGHALRVRRVTLAPDVEVKAGDAPARPEALTPGCIVRLECGHTRAGMVASRVTLLRAAAPRRTP